MTPKPHQEYPNVRCDLHPEVDEPGYIVCIHVLTGQRMIHHVIATQKSLGEGLCCQCSLTESKHRDLNDLRLICARCMDIISDGK